MLSFEADSSVKRGPRAGLTSRSIFGLLAVLILASVQVAAAQVTYSFTANGFSNGYCSTASTGNILPVANSPRLYAIARNGSIGRCDIDASAEMSFLADQATAFDYFEVRSFSDRWTFGGLTLANNTGAPLPITVTAFDDNDNQLTQQSFTVATGRQAVGFSSTGTQRVEIVFDTPQQTDVGLVDFIVGEATQPELLIDSEIPAAEGETVDVAVELEANGNALVATAFSVDYDEACLFFDDTDFDPIDGIPDAVTVEVPGDFTVNVFHDLGDSDGEIDILISDFSPPLATLSDGPLVTLTLNATCTPAAGASVIAPMRFSADPVPTFSDDLAQDLDGLPSDGSVEILPGPRGDCNGSGSVSVADIVGATLEIFDADGTFWASAPFSTYAGSPVGCDANADTLVNAGDVSCISLMLFGGSCSGSSESMAAGTPELTIDGATRLVEGEPRWVPVRLAEGGDLASLAFSLDLDPRVIAFDGEDNDLDGLPDGIRFPGAEPTLASVHFDARDVEGELDILLMDWNGALSDGVVLEILLEAVPVEGPRGASTRVTQTRVAKGLQFSTTPAVSFGTTSGQSMPGKASVLEAKR